MSETILHEKLGALDAKVSAAHLRMDRFESGLKDDLVEIKSDLKELSAYMNRGRGLGTAVMLLCSAVGAGLFKLLTVISK